MSAKKTKPPSVKAKRIASTRDNAGKNRNTVLFVAALTVITAVAFYPMLSNGFTNWDDQFYILNNPMLKGPDWAGILTKPLMANYHPLTVSTLALNYQLSGADPFSYHLVNYLVHILNAGLVFLLAFNLSARNHWVAFVTALLFAVHPMHVESVAWASERKDVLYTFFFLLSLLFYYRYIVQEKLTSYIGTVAMFALSLLSKPAAVTLPLVLLLMDWYQGRSMKEKNVWLEKIPFFAMSLIIGLMTIKYQGAVKAIISPDVYPFWQKAVFSVYGFGEYIKRFFWPFPMSAMHPFPESGTIPLSYYPSIMIALLAVAGIWFFRKKKSLVFGVGFYTINVLLVLQLLTFGHAIIAERYTYVPYIGLSFAMALLWSQSNFAPNVKKAVLALMLLFGLGLSFITYKQVQVWKNPETLWTNAIDAYPDSYTPRSNRGQYLAAKLGKFEEALADYAIALKAQPNDSFSLINRATIYINQQNFQAALADADSLVKHHPEIAQGYMFKGVALNALGYPQQAFDALSACIKLNPSLAEAWANRGIIRYNAQKDYAGAKTDFDQAIMLSPNTGQPYKNRARCWIKFGNKAEALNDLERARQLGVAVGEDLIQAANALP